MPIYDFKCDSCDHSFEAMVKMDDRNKPQTCPECGGSGKHVITPVHFSLPGHRNDWPTAAAKWTREHERAGERTKKREAEYQNDMNSSMY